MPGQVGCFWTPGSKKDLAAAACQRQMKKAAALASGEDGKESMGVVL